MKREDLERLSKEELIDIVLKQQEDLTQKASLCEYYYKEKEEISKALDAICFISNKMRR